MDLQTYFEKLLKIFQTEECKNVKAINPISQDVLWEKDIRGEHTNVLILGIPSEYERVISQALTKALNQAAKEFSSDVINTQGVEYLENNIDN